MIKNSLRQTGSAHVVIIIILVVAVLGLLGFVFWQNFIMKTPAEKAEVVATSTNEDVVAENPYKDWGTYESVRDGYSIKYPKDWTVIKETENDGPYIRNIDPSNSNGGYPEGYMNLRVLLDTDAVGFMARTDYTMPQWYEALGKTYVSNGPVGYSPEVVKDVTVNDIPAKSAKAVFTETDEMIYFLKNENLYNISLYPYGASSDPTIKLMLDSFKYL